MSVPRDAGTRTAGRPWLGWAGSAWGVAASLASPALRLLLRRRLHRGKEIAGRLDERRGVEAAPRPPGPLLWLHAASVGEVLSLLPLLQALAQDDPAATLLLTTGTATSQRLLEQRLPEAGLVDRVLPRFLPLDVPRWVGRFLDHWRPDLAVLVESEIWPGVLDGCLRRAIPLALVNARMSARSFARWRRLLRLPGRLPARLFGAFAWIAARSEEDAARLRTLGATRVESLGDLKRAAAPLPADMAELERLRAQLGDRPLWLAASTHDGEEAVAASLHARLSAAFPRLLTVIAPRHPERGEAVAAALGGAPRRALGQAPPQTAGLWIADTLGELGLLYRLCPIVFLGNSLPAGRPPGGGHNPLEPARLGCVLATGPRTQNFAQDTRELAAAGGLAVTPDEAALEAWLRRMLADPDAVARGGAAAARVCDVAGDLPATLARRLHALARSPR